MKNTSGYFAAVVTLLSVLFSENNLYSQVSGKVYRDINNNGARSSVGGEPFEGGVAGVTVKAYNTAGLRVDSVTTNASGDYTINTGGTYPVRLEFVAATNEFSGKRSAAGKSNIQFITGPTTTADYAIGYHTMYSNTNNPLIATNASSNGNALAAGVNEAGLRQNLIISPYQLDNTWKTGANYQNQWLGSVFGLTYQRETRTLLMAAYLKRHMGFGPGGIDAIYKTTVSTTGDAAQPAILLKLTDLGVNVGTDPRTVALPNNPATPNTDLGVFGQVGKRGIGNIDLAENGRDLYITNLFENKIHRVNIGMPVKTSFSPTDLTGSWVIPGPGLAGTEWHIMSVKYYGGLVYVGGVSSKQRTDAPVASMADVLADHVNLKGYVYALNPVTGTITEVLQFPFNYRRGQTIDQYRYEFKTNWWRAWQNNGDADVLRNDFNDALEVFPQPAAPYNTGNNTGIIYPQPMLSDIEFDTDGSMILAIRDRFGDQSGLNNYLEGANGNVPTASGQFFRGFSCGELLRAGKNGSAWTIENNATVTNNGVMANSNTDGVQGEPPAGGYALSGSFGSLSGNPYGWSATPGSGFGPGGRYYYYNHSYTSTGVPLANIQDGSFNGSAVHYNKSLGGIALMAGYDELIQTTLSPEGRTFSSGVIRVSNTGKAAGTNAGNMTDQQELVPGTAVASPGTGSDPSSFGKANGLGNIEILQDAMTIEIGNRIWNDANNNGVQDAGENGLGNVTVVLRSPGVDGVFGTGDDQTWSVITSTVAGSEGTYYFDNTIVDDNRKTVLGYTGLPANSGILNGQVYRIEIDPLQTALTGFIPTVMDAGGDYIDNDGSGANLPGVGYRIFANVNTTNNNYDFDFGFKFALLPVSKLDLTATCSGNTVQLKWETLDEHNTRQFFIEKSTGSQTTFTATASQAAAGNTNGSRVYTEQDDITVAAEATLYYRIKLVNNDGTFKYSNIAIIKQNKPSDVLVWPLPFNKTLNLLVGVASKQQATVQLVNAAGNRVYSAPQQLVKGQNHILITTPHELPAGMYLLRVNGEAGAVIASEKVIRQ
jgi:trimeric autotransporter adhesin